MKKHITRFLIFLSVILGTTACESNDWADVPSPVASFLHEYFPLQNVSECNHTEDGYHVKLHNSVAITFDRDYSWTSVNGYGNTLPEMFLFDQLPPAMYAYLQDLSLTRQVYSVTRDKFDYKVALLDYSVTYSIDRGTVTPDNTDNSTTVSELGMMQGEMYSEYIVLD
ncbi:MAG: hypothetical protein K2M68_05680 [Muribaculaceae bacterium]|nr:hypothetical protein [Muribaculaceae bacterium]